MNRFSLLFLILCLMTSAAFAQKNKPDSVHKIPATAEMIMQVRQLQEFADRFNYLKTPDNKKIDSAFMLKVKRNEYISLLFDAADVRLDTNSTRYSPKYKALKDTFIRAVCQRNLKLGKYIDTVYASAVCDMTYKGKAVQGFLTFRKYTDSLGATDWRITNALLPFINIIPSDSFPRGQYSIPPNGNETNFVRLVSLLGDKAPATAFLKRGFQPDMLTVLAFAMESGSLRLNNIKKISYQIYDIPGWIIELNEFNRRSINSGWLISGLIKLK